MSTYKQQVSANFDTRFEREGYADAIAEVATVFATRNIAAYGEALDRVAAQYGQGVNTIAADVMRSLGF